MTQNLQKDVAAIQHISVVPSILDVVCRTTGLGFAAIARVTEERWIACSVLDRLDFGLEAGGELALETTLCHEVRQSRLPVIINHVAEDQVFACHHTPAMYGFQSYISMPIVLRDGTFFGTLCALDPRPARLNRPEVIDMFRLFAELISFHLEAIEQVAASEASLLEERRIAKLREQFIAVLGHDLRNPLNAIGTGAELLKHLPQDPKGGEVVGMIQRCVGRMAELIDNVLDFARGRLGGGFSLNSRADENLEQIIDNLVQEARVAWPGREIRVDCLLAEPVHCDARRMTQLLSNLLSNALNHGLTDQPVEVRATSIGGVFDLSVTNAGGPIPPVVMERLFQPFSRGEIQSSQQGLGLGLYIAAEIARAHGGTLDVFSTQDETRFTLRMPSTRT